MNHRSCILPSERKRFYRATILLQFLIFMITPSIVQSIVSSSLQKPTVAVIGGGISGLSCAEKLSERYDVTVFDTGRLRPGGRCSSRFPNDLRKETDLQPYPYLSQYRIDHAAQVISVPQDSSLFRSFQEQVLDWESRGVLKQFTDGSVYMFHGTNQPVSVASSDKSNKLYYAKDGMGALALDMIKGKRFTVKQDVWVSPSNGVKWLTKSQQWRVQANGKVMGTFDHLIVAHNGKCADRLMSKTPANEIHSLLRVNFAPTVPANGGNRMTLGSMYSLSICLKSPSSLSKALPQNYVAGFIHKNNNLSFLTFQNRKLDQVSTPYEVWTILSTPKFAKRHKAPQEFLPEETIEEVSTILLNSLGELVNVDPLSIVSEVVDRRLQLWGAAIPMNVWKGKEGNFLYDPKYKVGVCGDWLLEPSIAGAWTSGRQLADFLVDSNSIMNTEYGLHGKFIRAESSQRLGISHGGSVLAK